MSIINAISNSLPAASNTAVDTPTGISSASIGDGGLEALFVEFENIGHQSRKDSQQSRKLSVHNRYKEIVATQKKLKLGLAIQIISAVASVALSVVGTLSDSAKKIGSGITQAIQQATNFILNLFVKKNDSKATTANEAGIAERSRADQIRKDTQLATQSAQEVMATIEARNQALAEARDAIANR